MRIDSVGVETWSGAWNGPGWPWETRNANAQDLYDDAAMWDPPPPAAPQAAGRRTRQLFVRIDAGGITARYGPIEAYAADLVRTVLSPWLVGRDATRIVELNDRMQRLNRHGRRGVLMTAIGAVDLCLWQLRGQVEHQSVHRLLGGPTRDRVAAYASMLGFSVEPGRASERAREYRDLGFSAQKWFFRYGPRHGEQGLAKNLAMAHAVREAVGGDYPLMFDAFNGWDVPYAMEMCRRLEPVQPRWMEEPFAHDELEGWKRLRQATRVPLATGEHIHTRRDLLPLLQAGVVDVVQCDPDWACGLTELTAIAHVAAAFGVPLIPHGHTVFPAVHLALAQPPATVPMVEFLVNIQPERYALYAESPKAEGGWIHPPTHDGLGVSLSPVAELVPAG